MIENPSYDEQPDFSPNNKALLQVIQADAAAHATDYEPTSPLGEPSHLVTRELIRTLRQSAGRGSYTIPEQQVDQSTRDD